MATVATSGSYNDLTNKPTIPAAVTVDSALSSTSTNPVQNKVLNAALAGKAASGHNHSGVYQPVGSYSVEGHKHTKSEITDFPTSITPTAHNQASNTINAMTGYSKPSATSAIAATDSLNAAIGKLEKALEGKQASGSYASASHDHPSYVNQNAFSNITVAKSGGGSSAVTVAADTATDTVTFEGSNVTITGDAANDKVTIGITKANVTAALGYTPPTTDNNTTYTFATGDANGQIKVTPSGGSAQNVSVKGLGSAAYTASTAYAAANHTHSYLEKTTYEKSAELACGSNGLVCLGKFGAYDTNITIELNSTTSKTYHATIVIWSQNVVANGTGGGVGCYVYDDADNQITPLLSVFRPYGSASRQIEVYANLPGWSKNLVHIQGVALSDGGMTDVLTSVSSIPTSIDGKIKVTPVNVLTTNFAASSHTHAEIPTLSYNSTTKTLTIS